ncbi:TPA: hypothetical protein ACFRHF_001466 [Neisseria lactamica]|nr:hypothetical protein [Neisseria lactamica]
MPSEAVIGKFPQPKIPSFPQSGIRFFGFPLFLRFSKLPNRHF